MNAAPQPSLFAQLVLAEKYGGMRLTMDQLAEALGMARRKTPNVAGNRRDACGTSG